VKDIIEQNTAGIYRMWNWWGTPKNPDAKNKKDTVTSTNHINPCKHSTEQKHYITLHIPSHTHHPWMNLIFLHLFAKRQTLHEFMFYLIYITTKCSHLAIPEGQYLNFPKLHINLMYCLLNSLNEAVKEYFMGTSKQDNRFTIFNVWFTITRKSSSEHDKKSSLL